jgi:YVTN family beta-propeller protein
VGSNPRQIALAPDGTFAYVTDGNDDTVSRIRVADGTVTATIAVGDYPDGVDISPDGSFAYVTNLWSNTISRIRTSDDTVIATTGIGRFPSSVAISPDGSFAYVTSAGADAVQRINTVTNSVTVLIPIQQPQGVAISPDGAYAYVATNANTVERLRTSDDSVVASTAVAGQPYSVAFAPDGASAFVSSYGTSQSTRIRTSDNAIAATYQLGSASMGVAVTSDSNFALFTEGGANAVAKVRLSDNRLVGVIDVGSNPLGLAVAPAGNAAYVANGGGNTVSILDLSVTPPNLNSVTPTTGSISGGTTIQLAGSDFSGSTTVTVGDVSATSIVLQGSSALTVLVPAHGRGDVDVIVSNAGWRSTLPAAFTYTGATQVVTWNPANASAVVSAGSLMPHPLAQTTGDGTVSYSVVSQGGTACSVDPVTARITFSTAGSCVVQATAALTPTFDSGTTSSTFLITADSSGGGGSSGGGSGGGSSSGGSGSGAAGGSGGSLHEILGLRPASGPLAGGNTMAIVGYGFTGVREVRIGDKLCQYTFVNDAHIDVVVPTGDKLGPADVSVVLPPSVGRAFAPGGYVYLVAPAQAPSATPPTSATTAPAIGDATTAALPRPRIAVTSHRVLIKPAAGSSSTAVQRRSGATWKTIRRIKSTSALTLAIGQYRVVSNFASGRTSSRSFKIR